MSKKMIQAPNFKGQPNEPLSDLIVLAGNQAWEWWGKGKGEGWLLLCQALQHNSKQKPIVLDVKQLNKLERLAIVPPAQKAVRVIQCGELLQAEVTALCLNLAKHSKVEQLALCNCIGEVTENLSDYIKRVRKGDSVAEIVSESITEAHKENNQANNLTFYRRTHRTREKGFISHYIKNQWING